MIKPGFILSGLFAITSLIACSDRDKKIKDLNIPPVMGIGLADSIQNKSLIDSIKLSHNPDAGYYFKVRIQDDNNNVSTVNYSINRNGTLYLIEEGNKKTELRGNFPKIDNGIYSLFFKPFAAGDYTLDFTVTDKNSEKDNVQLSLNAFDNLQPVPTVSFTEVSRTGDDITVKISMASSYDRDRNFGGGLSKYFLSILDKGKASSTSLSTSDIVADIIDNRNAQTIYTFKKGQQYYYKAYVMDNDSVVVGLPSNKFEYWPDLSETGTTIQDAANKLATALKGITPATSIQFN